MQQTQYKVRRDEWLQQIEENPVKQPFDDKPQ